MKTQAFLIGALFWLAVVPAQAASIMVAPTTIVLKRGGEIGTLYVTNRGEREAVAQIEGFDWSQDQGSDRLTPSSDLVLSPPMARIAPGVTQTIRLEATGAAAEGERSFRILVSEIPDRREAVEGVKLLLQFSIPVFVGGAAPGNSVSFDASRSENVLTIIARNNGRQHVKLSQLSVARRNGGNPPEKTNRMVYILPGSWHVWRFPKSDIMEGEAIRVEAQGEKVQLAADVTVGR